jgi:hypothetical protein
MTLFWLYLANKKALFVAYCVIGKFVVCILCETFLCMTLFWLYLANKKALYVAYCVIGKLLGIKAALFHPCDFVMLLI